MKECPNHEVCQNLETGQRKFTRNIYLEGVASDGKETRRLQHHVGKMRKYLSTECQLCQVR